MSARGAGRDGDRHGVRDTVGEAGREEVQQGARGASDLGSGAQEGRTSRRVQFADPQEDLGDHLGSLSLEELSYNLGSPIPNLRQIATRLDELWPLKDVIGKSLLKLHGENREWVEAGDVKMADKSAAAMAEGVRQSQCIVAVITGTTAAGAWSFRVRSR